MKVLCALCDKEMESREEDVYVTVSWVMEDLLIRNNIPYDKTLQRVVKLCTECWNALEHKPQGENTYWMFHKDI